MQPITHIRSRLGLTQAALAAGIGVTQGNVSHYERGQTVPPDVAAKLIDFASTLGVSLTFDDIYRPTPKETSHA
ncbi:helix-turn-helix domain-containing protein [Paracandidimonas soli]|uniref:helix-turn-helix domain-containing protein n=1 Tax=Paracandidimonas soli TaxID=1917182 RepID=UPI00104286AF|nr:helix-turn-helix transcriptional regulator [Paracandidimonas soli]